MNGETVICCDCAKVGVPSCERDGHGLVTLADLIDTYSNPASYDDKLRALLGADYAEWYQRTISRLRKDLERTRTGL